MTGSLRAQIAIPRAGYLAALSFGIPFLLANCLAYAIGWSDRFVLNYFLGPAAVGVYVAAYSIARQPVELFVGALNSFTFPLLVRAYATDGSRKAGPIQSGLLVTIATLGLGIVAGLVLFAEPLAKLLFPPAFHAEVVTLIPWIAAATFILSIKQFIFDNGLHVTQQNWAHLFTMMPAVVISIGLGIVLVSRYGIFGAAINYVVVATIATCVSAIFSFRVMYFAIPWRNLAKVAASALIATSATWWLIHHLAGGLLAILIAGAAVFCVVYGALLTVSGLSLWRMIETPWIPVRKHAQRTGFPRTAPCSAPQSRARRSRGRARCAARDRRAAVTRARCRRSAQRRRRSAPAFRTGHRRVSPWDRRKLSTPPAVPKPAPRPRHCRRLRFATTAQNNAPSHRHSTAAEHSRTNRCGLQRRDARQAP